MVGVCHDICRKKQTSRQAPEFLIKTKVVAEVTQYLRKINLVLPPHNPTQQLNHSTASFR